jgi:imidazolonepropionase
MKDLPEFYPDRVIDATGRLVLPAWCDSHTHIVYAGNREDEFVDRIRGLSYEQVAQKGGGILNSAKKLQNATEDELFDEASARIKEIMHLGTGAVEIKSGYGLTADSEIKMLRVIKKISQHFPITVKATFLGAHAFPANYKNDPQAYIDLICTTMLPAIAEENLATYIDVFCETGYFSVDQTDQILREGKKCGLVPKIHVNQFNSIGGVAVAVKNHALSVDHLEVMTDEDISALKNTEVMPVALPACSFFLGIPYTPARKMIDAGLALALATDFNPGSSPTGNMNFVLASACIKMAMTPEEAINAATVNAAYAMGLSDTHGSITAGKKANLILTKKIPSYSFLPYSFGSNLIESVFLDGKQID